MDTYSHIRSAACISGTSNRIYELARDSKVTKFDVSTLIKENVARFYISVDDLELFLQVVERLYSLHTLHQMSITWNVKVCF
jgi:hypothetical protein